MLYLQIKQVAEHSKFHKTHSRLALSWNDLVIKLHNHTVIGL